MSFDRLIQPEVREILEDLIYGGPFSDGYAAETFESMPVEFLDDDQN